MQAYSPANPPFSGPIAPQFHGNGIHNFHDHGLGLGGTSRSGGTAAADPEAQTVTRGHQTAGPETFRDAQLVAHRRVADCFHQHARALLTDPRFHPLTTNGRNRSSTLALGTREDDGQEYLQAEMNSVGLFDRQLRSSLPAPRVIDAQYWRRRLFGIRPAGVVVVRTLVPTADILAGTPAAPTTASAIRTALAETLDPSRPGPVTIVICSTSGFTSEARDLVHQGQLSLGRQARHLVLVEPAGPSSAGVGLPGDGWRITTPHYLADLTPHLDPEVPEAKRRRLVSYLQRHLARIEESAVSPTQIAAELNLPQDMVRQEMAARAPLSSRAPAPSRDLSGTSDSPSVTSSTFPTAPIQTQQTTPTWITRMTKSTRRILENRGWLPKSIRVDDKAREINERRGSLVQHRDHLYDYFQQVERREDELKHQFQAAGNSLTRKRITSQLLQLRKDAERKQQLLEVLNQQINVAGIHLHNLDLLRTGQIARLPEDIDPVADSVLAEDTLAELQAQSDLAITPTAQTSLAQEEAALLQQLEADLLPSSVTQTSPATTPPATAPSPNPQPKAATQGAPVLLQQAMMSPATQEA